MVFVMWGRRLGRVRLLEVVTSLWVLVRCEFCLSGHMTYHHGLGSGDVWGNCVLGQ
jgi:hypothetical protein